MPFIKFRLQQLLCIVNRTDGGNSVGAQMGTHKQGLRVVIADTADAGNAALKFIQIILEFCTEGCVFNVMDFSLKSLFLTMKCHTAFFCA